VVRLRPTGQDDLWKRRSGSLNRATSPEQDKQHDGYEEKHEPGGGELSL